MSAGRKQRELGAMRLVFEWLVYSPNGRSYRKRQLTLARHVADDPYAVMFDEYKGRVSNAHYAEMKPTGRNAIAARGEPVVTMLLARMLQEKRGLSAAARFAMTCSLTQGGVTLAEVLPRPTQHQIPSPHDAVEYLEATRSMVAHPDVSEILLFLCTNIAT